MIKVFSIRVNTDAEGMYDITREVKNYVRSSGVKDGIIVLQTLHTTCALTINENADPDVKSDILKDLGRKFPKEPYFDHFEGNSDAHVKTSIIGPSLSLIIDDGKALLGTWQGIYLMEFDGPRLREVKMKIMEDK